MRAFPTLILCWLATGFGALGGSILGNAGGPAGLRWGAILGGAIGLVLAVAAGRRLGWVPRGESAGAFLGGLAGFGVAIPIALSNMHTPVIPIASCALVGVGALIGAGVARGWRSPR
jgi:hypothetical protein